MPITPDYPGVYVEEVPSGSRTITGVSTSVTAFVGYFERGPMNEPVRVLSFADFERTFGGLNRDSEASYAIKQFFQNGGTDALVIRAAKNEVKAEVVLLDDVSGSDALTVTAANPGTWGNSLRLIVNYETTKPAETFNLTVEEYDNLEKPPVQVETFRNLNMDDTSSRSVESVVNEESSLVQVQVENENRPLDKMGTWGSVDVIDTLVDGDEASDPIKTGSGGLATDTEYKVDVTVKEEGSPVSGSPFTITVETPSTKPSLRKLLDLFQTELRTVDGLGSAVVELVEDEENAVQVHAPSSEASTILTFADNTKSLAEKLGLGAPNAPKVANVQKYAVGIPAGNSYGAESGGQEGSNGSLPGTSELIGDRGKKTGIYALEDADLFNILCIPRTANLEDKNAIPVVGSAIDYCTEQRAFMIVDIPKDTDEVTEVKDWVNKKNSGTLRSEQADHAALYFPRVNVPDPLDEYRSRTIGASGTLAGLYARTDTDRGVWKAPAGTAATLRGVRSLDYKLSDAENGELNPDGINALRTFDVRGTVSWGGRTLRGADQLADEYKYIPVRRLALYIEESLFRGLKWVVFEGNDETLWAQIRTNVNEFMQRLFRQGAFQGTSPREAYFVKCDSETTTQADIDRGIVNVVVGFAPLKPAEFVILKIKQKAGQE